MVSIVVQNLVEIDSGVSITWNFQYFPVWLENAYSRAKNWGFRGISPPKSGAMSTNPPRGTSSGRNGSSGLLIMSLSVIVPDESRGNKKVWQRRRTTHFWPFWHRCKMVVTWLYATLLISICSFCWGQHAEANIWSILLSIRFSGVAKNRP